MAPAGRGAAAAAAAAGSDGGRKRKRSALGCAHEANDVLVEELQKLKSRVRESSHLASNYGRAITSIRAHPLPLRSAREARQLKNIGNYLANQVHAILRKHQLLEVEEPAERPARAPSPPPVRTPTPASPPERPAPARFSSTLERPQREYVPAYRKQPWYVLLALEQANATDEAGAVAVDSLLKRMQDSGYDGNIAKLRACLASLTNVHEVVCRSASGLLYLTNKGKWSAQLCPGALVPSTVSNAAAAALDGSLSVRLDPPTPAPEPEPASSTDVVCIELSDSDDDAAAASTRSHAVPSREPPATAQRSLGPELLPPPEAREPTDLIRESDEWELVLLLDHREILSRRNRSILERKLLEKNVACEVCALNVGDVQWVARRCRTGEATQDFVLNAIVERKAVHDLSGSIIDRRYAEQKTRLKACGLTHVIYLVEGSLTQQTTVRAGGLRTAMCRTQVQNDFFVQLCQNADETVAFLAVFLPPNTISSSGLEEFAQLFCMPAQTFTAFNAQFRKKTQFTVGEIYQMMLMQAPGLSAAKIAGLSAKYATFQELRTALRKRGRESEVEHVRCGEAQRRLGMKAREALEKLLMASEYTEENAER